MSCASAPRSTAGFRIKSFRIRSNPAACTQGSAPPCGLYSAAAFGRWYKNRSCVAFVLVRSSRFSGSCKDRLKAGLRTIRHASRSSRKGAKCSARPPCRASSRGTVHAQRLAECAATNRGRLPRGTCATGNHGADKQVLIVP